MSPTSVPADSAQCGTAFMLYWYIRRSASLRWNAGLTGDVGGPSVCSYQINSESAPASTRGATRGCDGQNGQ